ncbi:hypothetical protein Tco_1193779 [Tanacetum coccineum]
MEELQSRQFRKDKIREEGHKARQSNKSKRPRNSAWFKEKVMLAEALELGMVLDEEQMAFLVDNRNTAPSASVVLMAKFSSYDSEVLSDVPIHDNYLDNHVIDQNVQEMQYSKQPVFDNDTDIDITSDSNMISCEQYLKETENMVVQDASSSAYQDAMIMYVVEEMTNQVAKCNKVDKENKIIHESLTAELERYKEQIKLFEERQQFDLNDREKYIDKLIISQDLVHTAMNSLAEVLDYQSMEKSFLDEYSECVELKAELAKKNDMVENAVYDELSKRCARLENRSQLEAKNNSISKLKDHIATLKGKGASKEAHVDYLKHTQENADTLHEIVKQARESRPLDSYLNFACKFPKRIQEVLVYVSATCPSSIKQVDSCKTKDSNKPLLPSTRVISSASASGSKSPGNTKKNRIPQPTSINKKNKVEDHLRSVKHSLNKKNHVSEHVCDAVHADLHNSCVISFNLQ